MTAGTEPKAPISIRIDEIDRSGRLRSVDEEKVKVLVATMQTDGVRRQINSIEVRCPPSGGYKLINGAHRCLAATILGWEEINAVVVDCDDEEARLREIDENLGRVELSPFDQANFFEERRQIWERRHGRIARGGDRRSKVQIAPLIEALKERPRFVADTAAAFGLSKDVVKRALRRKAHIAPELWNSLRGTSAAENGALLDKLAKLPLETQQEVWATAVERGCAMKEAVRIATQLPPKDPRTAQFSALCVAWEKAGPEARSDFLKIIQTKKQKN